jgi:long-subunit fatty acid transport protein
MISINCSLAPLTASCQLRRAAAACDTLNMRWPEFADAWSYYTGITYDENPAEPQYRISILPVDEQWRYSAGATYQMKSNRKLGAALTYVDLRDARIESHREIGNVVGDYSTNYVVFLGINYSWL